MKKNFDLKDLYVRFVVKMFNHENDTTISREESRIEAEGELLNYEGWEEDVAPIINAFDELCEQNEGLRESVVWVCGASFVGLNNPWDVYLVDKDNKEV